MLTNLLERIDGFQNESIEFQRELTRIPALAPENGGDGEKQKLDFLRQWLEHSLAPDELREIQVPDDRVTCGYRPNLVTRFRGRSSERTIWIMTHVDVVPPGDLSKWSGDPWTLRVQPGNDGRTRLIGRGVEDNQQGLASAVYAVKALRDLNVMPEFDVGLIFVADEETGNQYGIKHIVDHHQDLFKENDLVIIPDAGNQNGTMIEIAEKSIVWIKFRTIGVQTHASEPEKGRNAHRAACFLVTRLHSLYGKYRRRDPMFDPPISTFEPTKREANVPNVNTIPGEDTFYFDCRILPHYQVTEVMKHIRQIAREIEKKFRVKIEISTDISQQAAPPTASDAPVVQAVSKAVRELRRLRPKPMGIGGGTVALFFRSAGIPAAVWSTMDDTAHSADEYCLVDNMLNDAKVFAHVFLQKS